MFAAFACCVGVKEEPGEVIETKSFSILEDKGTQAVFENEDESKEYGAFTVVVPGKCHETLGLKLESSLDKGPTIAQVRKGAVDDFNQLHPFQTIQAFDMLLQIGAIRGKNAILDKLGSPIDGDVVMTFHRPRRVDVLLQNPKPDQLGIKLMIKNKVPGAMVLEVHTEGLIPTWNQQHPDEAICQGDRVLAINSVTEFKETLADMLSNESELLLTFPKYWAWKQAISYWITTY